MGWVLLVALVGAAPAEAEQMVRIAVGRFRSAMSIAGPGLSVETGDGTRLHPHGPLVLAPTKRGILVGGKPVDTDLLRIRSTGDLTLRGHTYRRELEVSHRSFRGRAELLVVHPLPLETYVVGIVSSELPHKWPLEALKAQAVAARTYAVWQKYRRLELPYHMESTVLDQVYHGKQRESDLARTAAEQTRGIVMTHARRPVQAYFHAACGGRTESARAGWGNALPYLPGSPCRKCNAAPRYKWSADVSADDMTKAMGHVLGERVTDVVVVTRTKTGRVAKVKVAGPGKSRTITGGDLRRLVGYTKLWSTQIDSIQKTRAGFHFVGRGAGHGVGMCQWGARGFAEAGTPYDKILENYYPGAVLTRMY